MLVVDAIDQRMGTMTLVVDPAAEVRIEVLEANEAVLQGKTSKVSSPLYSPLIESGLLRYPRIKVREHTLARRLNSGSEPELSLMKHSRHPAQLEGYLGLGPMIRL